MRKSKLENYRAILSALVSNPLTLDSIAYICKMDCISLSQRIDFLCRNNLVEEKNKNKKISYAITRRGEVILKTLTIAKRLEGLQTAPL